MNTQHTPGPWRIDPEHPLCIESGRGNIALVNLARASEADARLIAAAPEMLEALKLAQMRILELSLWAKVPADGQTFNAVCAAIAKAEGFA
jgi:hypothetical protein